MFFFTYLNTPNRLKIQMFRAIHDRDANRKFNALFSEKMFMI